MCSLAKFPPLPQGGHVNVCEVEGKVQNLPYDNASNVDIFTNTVALHPRVNVAQEIGAFTLSRHDASRVFVPTGDSFLKQVVCTWYESGILAAVSAACREGDQGQVHYSIRRCAQLFISAVDFLSRLRNKFHPHLREKGEDLTAVVAQCRDWSLSPVRCIDWHPHTTKFAVAAGNDSVRIYSMDSTLVPVLKCQTQTGVSCLAWRPFSSSEIAVGCQKGVFLWTVDPTSVVARPSMSCAQILERPGHAPITSVAWAREGDLLVSASASDNTMYIWDPAQRRSAPLRRVGGGGVCLAAWSPVGERLFAATAGLVFRVWCTKTWIPERWSTLCGRVQTACWSPCGSILLFSTTAEPLVYALRFDGAASAFGREEEREAKVVIDLNLVEMKDETRAGGLVSSMAWDRRGLHLAIVFRDSNVIAVFRTQLGITFSITPCCFINGLPGETPSTVAFQKNFEEGSMLTIECFENLSIKLLIPIVIYGNTKLKDVDSVGCHFAGWSSGRLQHFPIICSDLDLDSNLALGQSFKSPSSSFNKSCFSRNM